MLHLAISIDPSEPDVYEATLVAEVQEWVVQNAEQLQCDLRFFDARDGGGDEAWEQGVGVALVAKAKGALKAPLNALYTIAKKHKCEFVVAIVSADGSEVEDVCYFGHEEGKPDVFEIASYLGL